MPDEIKYLDVKAGDKVKLLRKPWTKYGFRVSNTVCRDDDHIQTGEIGEVVERKWIAWDGRAMSGLFVEWSRGRGKAASGLEADTFRIVKRKDRK